MRRRFSGKLGGLDLWMRLRLGLMKRMRDFDVVTIATQSYVELRPVRQRVLLTSSSQITARFSIPHSALTPIMWPHASTLTAR